MCDFQTGRAMGEMGGGREFRPGSQGSSPFYPLQGMMMVAPEHCTGQNLFLQEDHFVLHLKKVCFTQTFFFFHPISFGYKFP